MTDPNRPVTGNPVTEQKQAFTGAVPELGTNNAAGQSSTANFRGGPSQEGLRPGEAAPAAPITGEAPRTDVRPAKNGIDNMDLIGWNRYVTALEGYTDRLERELAEANRQRVFFQNLAKSNLLDAESAERQLASVQSATQPLKAEKDEAYRQRNVLVAALARMYPSGIRRTEITGWSDDWHGCCFIDLPSGQISYHYHDSQAHLFECLPPYTKEWDGHDKKTVEDRLLTITAVSTTGPTWQQQALAQLGSVRDSMHPHDVGVVQRFIQSATGTPSK